MTQRHDKPISFKELLARHGGKLPVMAGGQEPKDALAEITAKINTLTTKAEEAVAAAQEAGTSEALAEVKALVNDEIKPQLDTLTAEREQAIRETEFKSLQTQVTTLKDVIADLRKGPEGLMEAGEKGMVDADDPYGEGSKFSVFNDIRLANKGVSAARERLLHGFENVTFEGKALNEEGKAMTEGTPAQGGYLVRPQVERQLVEARELDNILRGLCSKLNVTTNQIQLDQLGISTTAGWVAELATKPESTAMTLASITASVFTAAGLVTVSNQLLADSNPAVDALATADLAKRLVALEETAFLNGTGVGQPLGILQTPGLGTTPLATTAIEDLLIAILTAIGSVEENHGSPSAILMHPRTWTRILVAQMTGDIDPGAFMLGGGDRFDVTQPRTRFRGPAKVLWGYPVVLTNRMPTNLGTGTDESRVIVGDFSEALILDRQGITVDESSHVYFTTNQTVFRAEERVGFTAARTPLAFNVVGGAGLADG
jgi:HK97 family phage major capsid protein